MVSLNLPVTTERLVLRPFEDRDLDAQADMRSRPEVVRYLYFNVQSRDDVARALSRKKTLTTLEKEGDILALVVELRDGGALAGDVILQWLSEEHRQGEIGFIFHPDHQGKGYATEAATALLRIGFEDLGLHRITGRCEAGNTASARLMERLGMRQEAHLRENEFVKGRWDDELIFTMLDREWEARMHGLERATE